MTWDREFFYDAYPRVEEQIGAVADRSLKPRGPEFLYALVRSLDLPPDSDVVDVGCGEGRHTARLALHFGFQVLGVDPVARHLHLARQERDALDEHVSTRLSFARGSATQIPRPNSSVDLIWCRDALVHEPDLAGAFAEFARVLRPGGWVLNYQMVTTALLGEREAAELLPTLGVIESSADPAVVEDAFDEAGLTVEEDFDLTSEWGELAEEHSGAAGRALVRLARLRRDAERYRSEFGPEAYDVLLADCRWHVYRMLGKLSGRVWLLRKPTR